MGFLRFYLALCVVQAHAGNFIPWPVPRGRHAVELFFIVSGFYMAMVLSGRYRRTADFYRSRWLRIAVPYYWHLAAIVGLSVLAGLLFSQWLSLAAWADQPFARNGAAGVLLAGLTNLTIFGQDAVLYLRDNLETGLRPTGSFASHADPLYVYLVMPQCWSVAIELVFYLVVPFLNRLRTRSLVALLSVSVFMRLTAYRWGGLDHDPWVYRFLPFELAFFLAGMLGWRVLSAWKGGKIPGFMTSWPVYLLLCAGVVATGWLFRVLYNASWSYPGEAYAGFFLCLISTPLIVLLFVATSAHPFDRAIGELSYPIYLNHLFFIVAARVLGDSLYPQAWSGLVAGLSSIAAAALFWHFILRRFEEKRHRMFGLQPA